MKFFLSSFFPSLAIEYDILKHVVVSGAYVIIILHKNGLIWIRNGCRLSNQSYTIAMVSMDICCYSVQAYIFSMIPKDTSGYGVHGYSVTIVSKDICCYGVQGYLLLMCPRLHRRYGVQGYLLLLCPTISATNVSKLILSILFPRTYVAMVPKDIRY
jgi:hypothetical protein